MTEDIVERLGFLRFEGQTALLTGLCTAELAAHLVNQGMAIATSPTLDTDRPIDGAPFDLIACLGSLETINDLPGALIQARHALAPGGLLLAALVGAGSLPELRRALLAADADRPAARIHPQVDNRAASALLARAGFERQVVDHYPLSVRYGSLERLVADLRDQGLTSALRDAAPPLGKEALARARTAFFDGADADGKIAERFEILTLTAWNN